MVFYLEKEEKAKIINHYLPYEVNNKNVHVEKVYKYNNLTISLYNNKVLFQGPLEEIVREYRDY